MNSFAGADGSDPEAPLIDVKGTLYGTTVYGGYGSSPNGTVYSVTTSGNRQVLHYFNCNNGDGCLPLGGLINVNGTLYGTTAEGGTGCSGFGCGVVYSISTSGSENVLYRFTGGSDGHSPKSSLVNVNGTLYGTTEGGGSGCTDGSPIAYSVTTTGTEHVIHSFTGGRDGALPQAGLIDVNGALYGTTVAGGGTSCVDSFDYHGCRNYLQPNGQRQQTVRYSSQERVRRRAHSKFG